MINHRWHRWIQSSILTHFKTGLDAFMPPVVFFAEGDERGTENLAEWVELRVDGPTYKETTRNMFRVTVEVNVAVFRAQDHAKLYGMAELMGKVSSLFTCINIYKNGDVADDAENTGDYLESLQLKPENFEKIPSNYFGKVNPTHRIEQATIEGHYQVYLQGD